MHFIRSYLDTMQREVGSNDAMKANLSEERLFREADCYLLASHFFWGLWSVVNAPVSTIPFGYWVISSFIHLALHLCFDIFSSFFFNF